MASHPLTNRDINQLPSNTSPGKDQTKSMEYHRQMLESRLREDKQNQQNYISPSDNILSPASQKLAAFKNKRNEKSAKPRSLFAKTMEKNANAAPRTDGFADIVPSRKASSDHQSA